MWWSDYFGTKNTNKLSYSSSTSQKLASFWSAKEVCGKKGQHKFPNCHITAEGRDAVKLFSAPLPANPTPPLKYGVQGECQYSGRRLGFRRPSTTKFQNFYYPGRSPWYFRPGSLSSGRITLEGLQGLILVTLVPWVPSSLPQSPPELPRKGTKRLQVYLCSPTNFAVWVIPRNAFTH